MLWIPHCLDNRLTDGGEVVSLTHLLSTPQKHFFVSNTHFWNAYRLLVGKPEEKRPLGRPRRRWADNIRMDILEVGWGGVD
jgi:hypothetical protein